MVTETIKVKVIDLPVQILSLIL